MSKTGADVTQEEVDDFLESVAEQRDISIDDAEYVMERTLAFMLGKKLENIRES